MRCRLRRLVGRLPRGGDAREARAKESGGGRLHGGEFLRTPAFGRAEPIAPIGGRPANDPEAGSHARSPRLRVLRGDGEGQAEIAGAKTATVESNTRYRADRFELQFAMNADPAFGRRWWATQAPPMLLDVQIGFSYGEGARWQSMVIEIGWIKSRRTPRRGLSW